MRRLAPATLELQVAGLGLMAVGAVAMVRVAATGGRDDLRALGAGLGVGVLVLWGFWASRAVRIAIRLALPVQPRWVLEAPGATVVRVVLLQVLPLGGLVLMAGAVAADRVDGAVASAAGLVAAAGLAAVLAAARVRRAERLLGRRLLRRPGSGAPLGRGSLSLEPRTPGGSPGGSAAPWPAHRAPPRVPTSAMELDPANPPATHPVGVSAPRVMGRAAASRHAGDG